MENNPVIIQIDEDENYFTVVDLICYGMELSIAARARTIQGAKDIIASIESGKLKPDIAIITSMIEIDVNDGKKFDKKLREICPNIKTIAYTVDPEVDWGDFKAAKSSKDSSGSIIAILEQLTGKSYKYSNLGDTK